MKRLLVVCIYLFSVLGFAGNTIDFFGDKNVKKTEILKKYGKEINQLAQEVKNKYKSQIVNSCSKDAAVDKLMLKKKSLEAKIKKEFDYAYVDIEIEYQHDIHDIYTTVEVINKSNPERLRLVSKKACNKARKRADLIDEAIYYDTIGEQNFFKNKKPINSVCDSFICTWGFAGELKPFLNTFKNGAKYQKQLIISSLSSSDPLRRNAGLFLLGFFEDPKEIISLASPLILDKNREVRNTATSLISSVMTKTNLTDINVMPALKLLASPYTSDRNAALYLLLNAAKNSNNARQIIKNSGDNILAILHLHKKDEHKLAYYLLKELSNKNYAANNFSAWEKWLHLAQQ